MKNLRIVFMGTPDFAVESLRALVENGYNVVGVITMPDKQAGRGHKVQYSPVKQYALENDLCLLQPEKLKDEVFLSDLKSLHADLQIVVAFRMLPEVVWNMPPLGTFNLHASLLPQYRGAAPINRAVINGEIRTGITTFFLKHEIDTGGIILQEAIDICQEDNAGTVHDKLMVLGARLVCKTVDLIESENCEVREQSEFFNAEDVLKMAPKIFKEDAELKSEMNVRQAHNLVRGMSPHPGAWKMIRLPGQQEDVLLKVYESSISNKEIYTDYVKSAEPGSLIILGKKEAGVLFTDGILLLKSVQLPGKKRMNADEWLRGLHIPDNS